MLLSGKDVLRVCASSGLFLRQSSALKLPARSGLHLSSPPGLHVSSSSRRATTLTSMGPIHGSATVAGKTKRIHSLLRERHDPPADGLQVIMDFDLTMTAPGSEQCHHMFETSSALPEELRSRLAPFFTGEMELTTRDAWWEDFHAVLCDARITRAQVAAVAGGADLTLRPGTADLMLLLQERGVPLLVVSAGITDVVAETLRLHGLLLDNVTVRANTMLFGEDERLERFRESPPVHSRNKDQTVERHRSYFFDSHQHRRCVVVVGDKPGDADVTAGFAPDDRCLKIGFFDHSHEHPHPDLPPLSPPTPAEATAHGGRAGGACSDGGGSGAVLEGLEFLRGSNGPVLMASSPAARSAGGLWSREEEDRIQGRPGSQGGGEVFRSSADEPRKSEEGEGREQSTAVAAGEMLRSYGDSFDVVACGGHSMDVVADFVRHFVGALPPDGVAAANS